MNTILLRAMGVAVVALLLAVDASAQSRGFGSGGSGPPSIGAPSKQSGPAPTRPSLSPRTTMQTPIVRTPPSRVQGPGTPRQSSGTTSYYKNSVGMVPYITSPAARPPDGTGR